MDELALRVTRLNFVANRWNIYCCVQQDSSSISLYLKLKITLWLTYDCLNGTLESSVHTDGSEAFGARTHLDYSCLHFTAHLNYTTELKHTACLVKKKKKTRTALPVPVKVTN